MVVGGWSNARRVEVVSEWKKMPYSLAGYGYLSAWIGGFVVLLMGSVVVQH